MANFYARPENVGKERVSILGKEARHIFQVLRHKVGDKISVVDGRGMEYEVELEAVSLERVQGRILERRKGEREPLTRVTLAQSIPKGSRMDYLIEKATELGVDRVIPVVSARSQVLPDGDSKVRRWRRIALSAMKQSGRSILPAVEGVIRLPELLDSIEEQDLSLIAWEGGGKRLGELLHDGIQSVLLVVGPEGGFQESEVNLVTRKGALAVTLGKRTLRSETAGIALLTVLLHELGDL